MNKNFNHNPSGSNQWSLRKDTEEIQKIINLLKEDLGVGMPQIGKPLRLAIAGTLSSPSIDETVEVLGKEKVISRLEQALDKFS